MIFKSVLNESKGDSNVKIGHLSMQNYKLNIGSAHI